MEYKQLRYLTTIAEYGSFTEAANVLHVSQPSLSHMVSQIEKQLGVTLFDRSCTPLKPTYAGEIFISYAEGVLSATNNMESQMRDIAENKKGRLRIGIPYERSAYILPRIIPPFRSSFPGILVEITDASGNQLLNLLERGRIDFAIMPVYGTCPDHFDYQKIFTEPLLLSAPTGTLPEDTASGNIIHVEKLKDLNFILQSESRAIRVVIDHILAAHNIRPHITQIVSGNTSAYGLSKSGLGVAIVPEVTIALNGTDAQSSIYTLQGKVPTSWDICALYRKNTYIGVVEQKLLEIIHEICGLQE